MMSSRPNVILAVFDSLSARFLDQHIHELPTLRSLKQSGVSFNRTYVCSPESSPARASLFTGLDMAAHRVWSDGVELPMREKTLSEVFASNGYQTSLIGRRQLAGVSNWTTEHPRASEYHRTYWAHGPLHRSRQNAYLSWLQETQPDTYTRLFPNQPNPDDTHVPAWQYQAMIDLPDNISFNAWIGKQYCTILEEQAVDKPYLGVLGFVVGETMGVPVSHGSMRNEIVEASTKVAVQQADSALATILKQAPDNTVVVVSSGRGSLASDKQQPFMHNDAIRVPLFVNAPGFNAKTIESAVSTIDIAPTLFNLANIDSPQRVQGQCLLRTAARGWAFSRLRSANTQHISCVCNERWKLVMLHAGEHVQVSTQSANKTSINTNDYPQTSASSVYELFDLHADPNELNNLANSEEHDAILEDMIDLMIDARVALEDRTEPRIASF